ncbi:uncharacterized protein LOC118763118 isoform X2 [Octopus sinensis]|uniref:Uncharacterized protein LOC118763118 isoform X2 n=1 Tax=Octopus sinensis TaxID=2607531 RepID=A0A7E6ESR4_9MOLL|nr:uncharacterized protein LOC118763118 isoform X2 [Octopus sinensis]
MPVMSVTEAIYQRFKEKNIIEACAAETCDVPLPHTYVVQHLNEETIEIDGLIDEFAWNQVPWSEKFVDLQGRRGHDPVLTTRFKIRWDDNNLYIAALLEDPHVWANRTEHDSDVFNDNAFEIFLDTAGSFHKYKEIGVNAFSTVWDALLTKAYIDGGEALQNWDSRVNVAVNVDGEVNNPNSQGDFWSVEMSLPFSQLLVGSVKTDTKPHNLEIWYANFARSHIQASAHGDHYHPIPNIRPKWWSWNPTGAYSLHLPNRWGLIQFKASSNGSSSFNHDQFIPDDYRTAYHTLGIIFESLHKYKALFGSYVSDITQLDLPPYINNKMCTPAPQITLDWRGFVVSLTPDKGQLQPIHIRADRFVWFGHIDKLGKNY